MSISPSSGIVFDAARAASPATRLQYQATPGANLGHQASKADKKKPYREFEAYALQSFIQPMLPKNTSQVFGSGTAGEVWKSMLAEHMGREFAKNGGIGIAASLEKSVTGTRPSRPFGWQPATFASIGNSAGDRLPSAGAPDITSPGTQGLARADMDKLLGQPARFKWLPATQAADWNQTETALGLPHNFIATNANIESGGHADLRDPGNSNMGLHQFAHSDMKELLGRPASPLDPRAATDALIVEAKRNQTALAPVLGHNPLGGELYVAHQQGTTGARALFGSPDASAVDVLEGVYKNRRTAMRAIKLNIPTDSPLRRQDLGTITAQQFTDLWVHKFNRQAGDATPMVASASPRPSVVERPAETGPRFLSANLSPHIQSQFLSRLPSPFPATPLAADEPAGA